MAARDFQTLTRARSQRARELAAVYPAARQVLMFLAQVADFQAGVASSAPLDSLPGLVALTLSGAPSKLAGAARDLDRDACQQAMDEYLLGGDTSSPGSFFARVMLQPVHYGAPLRKADNLETCPCCLQPPQAGLLRDLAHGQAFSLSCSLCFHEWSFPRSRCAGCGQTDARRMSYFKAEDPPHVQVMTCDACRRYMHVIDMGKEPRAIADIDEVSALPLDVWAIEKGYSKVQPNLAGI